VVVSGLRGRGISFVHESSHGRGNDVSELSLADSPARGSEHEAAEALEDPGSGQRRVQDSRAGSVGREAECGRGDEDHNHGRESVRGSAGGHRRGGKHERSEAQERVSADAFACDHRTPRKRGRQDEPRPSPEFPE
jgi:hypothetical protein